MVASLREQFPAVIVELPAIDDPSFGKLPIAVLVDAVILVADSKSAQPNVLRRAAEKFHEACVPLAAAMLDIRSRRWARRRAAARASGPDGVDESHLTAWSWR